MSRPSRLAAFAIILVALAAAAYFYRTGAGSTFPPPTHRFVQPLDVTSTDFAAEVVRLVEQYQPPAAQLPGARNAWPLYVRAASIMWSLNQPYVTRPADDPGDPRPLPDFTLFYSAPARENLSDDDRDAAIAVTQRLMHDAERSELFSLLAEARTLPRIAFTPHDSQERADELAAFGLAPEWDGRLFSTTFPELGQARSIARLLAARMHLAAAQADWPAFTDSMESLLGLGHACMFHPTLIGRLVGIAIRALAFDRVLAEINTHHPADGQLVAILAALDRHSADIPNPSLQLRAERLGALDICNWAFDSGGLAELSRFSGGSPISSLFFRPRREPNVAALESFYSGLFDYAELPPPQRRRAPQPDAWLNARTDSATLIARLVAVAIGSTLDSDSQHALKHTGLRAAIAVERFHRQTGAYPDSWDDLIARALLPAPPFDPVSGSTLRYRLLDAPNPRGLQYLIYSIGADELDDAGAEPPKRSTRFKALHSSDWLSGFDFVVNETE